MNQRDFKLDAQKFRERMIKLSAALKQMGYESLREAQKEPVNSILMGRDTLCVLSTSFGKSAVYAIPTIINNYRTIVFSPLIALMKDQVENMNKRGIPAGCVNSSQGNMENHQVLQDWSKGALQMLYVAPERIGDDQFEAAMRTAPPQFVAMDEAHSISVWGASFRPAYCNVGDFIDRYNPEVVAAFTATATKQVVSDIRRIARMDNCHIVINTPARTNLKLSSEEVDHAGLVPGRVLELVRSIKGSIIVYCQTVKQVIEIEELLRRAGESVTFYHGQIPNPADKVANQDAFMTGEARICVATNAFGMGVDKPDIRGIIHASPPSSVEAIAQEVGRAARDGKEAVCHMLWTRQSLNIQWALFKTSNPEPGTVRKAWTLLQQYADGEGIARVTGEELAEQIKEPGAEAACNLLETQGCVKRFRDPKKIYTFYETGIKLETPLKSGDQEFVNIVKEFGADGGKNEDGEPIYRIDLDYLASKLRVLPNTVTTKIRNISKLGVFRVDKPFVGKCTQLIHPPTAENLANIEARHQMERQKIMDARQYLDTPDKDKHKYLTNYFAQAREIVS